jgi:hypothetical protein
MAATGTEFVATGGTLGIEAQPANSKHAARTVIVRLVFKIRSRVFSAPLGHILAMPDQA